MANKCEKVCQFYKYIIRIHTNTDYKTVIMCQYYMLTFLIKLLEPYCSKHQNKQRQFILRLKQTPTYGCGKRQQTGHLVEKMNCPKKDSMKGSNRFFLKNGVIFQFVCGNIYNGHFAS